MKALLGGLRELFRYKSAVFGLVIIFLLVLMAIYTVITIPYDEAVRLWRGGRDVWVELPRNALPRWVNLLPGTNRPENIVVSSKEYSEKEVIPLKGPSKKVKIELPFKFAYDDFPKEVSVRFLTSFKTKAPFVLLKWQTPDGREVELGSVSLGESRWHLISLQHDLARKLGAADVEKALFGDPQRGYTIPLKGDYKLLLEAYVFEENTELDAKLIVYGAVYGLAGTDHRRRDLTVALLWGAPIALAFGLLAAFGSVITTLIIAAIGAWFGGIVDAFIQRLTEIRMILPTLPILIMVGMFYSRSIWVILGVLIILGIVGAAVKTFRAMFLQVKNSPYIEAARSYGAGNFRIIFRYLVPRAIPWIIPSFVLLIPSFVFLEASLAVIGLGDPVLPTWGKVIHDAYEEGALYMGHYYWMLQPTLLLMLTGFGFATVGFTLDKIFNPRLREI